VAARFFVAAYFVVGSISEIFVHPEKLGYRGPPIPLQFAVCPPSLWLVGLLFCLGILPSQEIGGSNRDGVGFFGDLRKRAARPESWFSLKSALEVG